jgi:hypothetical protein
MQVPQCDIKLCRLVDALTGSPAKHSSDEEIDDVIRDEVWPTFFETAVGQNFKQNYELTQDLTDAFVAEFGRRFGVAGKIRGGVQWPGLFLAVRIEEVIGDLVKIKHPCLTPKNKPAPCGQGQTEAEKRDALRAEVLADIGDPFNGVVGISTLGIKRKKQTVPGYAAAFDAVQAELVEDGYKQGPRHEVTKPDASSDLKQFAHMLNSHISVHGTPKPVGGYYFIQPEGSAKKYEYKFNEFQELIGQADAAGLLR